VAGHSKWANIQHRKKAQDAKRGKVFTRLIREITIAARMGGADADANPRLRLAIDKAKVQSVPKDTIERAAKRGAGELDGENVEEICYEGYGPGGVAVMVDCVTDNRNRTVADVRHAFTKCGGNLGTTGSVAYLFEKKGILSYPPGSDEDAVMEAALEAGAADVIANEDGSLDVLSEPEEFLQVKEHMVAAGLEPDNDEVTMYAQTTTPLDQDNAETMVKLLEMLEDLDDVQNVYSNADISEEILAQID
jgi:YebC/PmpR family DNA-binding regulatory protein